VLPVTGCAEAQTVTRKAQAKSTIFFIGANSKKENQQRTWYISNLFAGVAEITGAGLWVML
jgi:hypothetical protein